ncbi:uncharacterized protein KY384_008737 [Bacidia gigantensis]|uniref:uncharacterized protein n=1 Tax=Bacidia gigantensis TaxID=2732470 RepID=UPI001D053413|nr:uncharacterized protein KY384_008737 [Bacidia gigantensis]KAG8526537.1 hypothetical protein KY384_008737 [Bacidia gigantensis]
MFEFVRIQGVTPTSSFSNRHGAYVDQKVKIEPIRIINHGSWYGRSVIFSTTAAPYVSNATSLQSTLSTLSKSVPADSASVSPNFIASLANLDSFSGESSSGTPSTTSISSASDDLRQFTNSSNPTRILASATPYAEPTINLTDWDAATDIVCLSALIDGPSNVSNPSGMIPCYNIYSFDQIWGIFEVDLRIYRTAWPTGEWAEVNDQSISIGMKYEHANVTRQVVVEGNGATRSEAGFERDSEVTRLMKRGNNFAITKFGELRLQGQLEDNMGTMFNDSAFVVAILTPDIRLSAVNHDGSKVVTNLEVRDTAFLYGVLAPPQSQKDQTSVPPTNEVDSTTYVSYGIKTNVVPITVLVAGVWAIVMLILTTFEVAVRLSARNEYRKAQKEGRAKRPFIVSWD